MTYTQKNTLMKGARKDQIHSEMLLLSFLRGYSVGENVRVLSASDSKLFAKPTIHRFFNFARSQLFDDPEFFDSIRDDLTGNDQLRGIAFLLERISSVEQSEVFRCAYRCDKGYSPKQIHLAMAKNNSEEEMFELLDTIGRVRARCRTCALKVGEFQPAPLPTTMVSDADGRQIDSDDPQSKVARALAYLVDCYQERNRRFDALGGWLCILIYLGKFRRVNEKNIGRFLRCSIVHYAIERTTVRVPRTLSFEGSNYTFGPVGDDSNKDKWFNMQNSLEEKIFMKAREYLEARSP